MSFNLLTLSALLAHLHNIADKTQDIKGDFIDNTLKVEFTNKINGEVKTVELVNPNVEDNDDLLELVDSVLALAKPNLSPTKSHNDWLTKERKLDKANRAPKSRKQTFAKRGMIV